MAGAEPASGDWNGLLGYFYPWKLCHGTLRGGLFVIYFGICTYPSEAPGLAMNVVLNLSLAEQVKHFALLNLGRCHGRKRSIYS